MTMNGPLKIYRVKQIVRHDLKVQLPDCMYKLKNLHASRNPIVEQRTPDPAKKLDIFDQVKQFLKNNENSPEMATLELRQDEILKQLAELKKQMDSIRENLKISHVTVPELKTTIKSNNGLPPTLPDIIINASPTNPPYSLQLIQKLWKNYIFLNIKTYVHSSVATLNENVLELTKTLEEFSTENVPKVNVKLIWKDVGPNTELVISNRPIAGEVNILRYLSRVSPSSLNYETYENSHDIDQLLDISYNIVKAKTKTERASLLQILHKSLGKSNYLAGRAEISIADLAAYSAIKQVCASEVNVNLGKWLQRITVV